MILLWNQCTDGVKINSMIDLAEATRIQLRRLLLLKISPKPKTGHNKKYSSNNQRYHKTKPF